MGSTKSNFRYSGCKTPEQLKKIAQDRAAAGHQVIDQSAGDIDDVGEPLSHAFIAWIDEARADGVPVDDEITMIGRINIYPNATEIMEDNLESPEDGVDEMVRDAIADGSYHPFTGPLKKQDGSDWLADGETADDGTLADLLVVMAKDGEGKKISAFVVEFTDVTTVQPVAPASRAAWVMVPVRSSSTRAISSLNLMVSPPRADPRPRRPGRPASGRARRAAVRSDGRGPRRDRAVRLNAAGVKLAGGNLFEGVFRR